MSEIALVILDAAEKKMYWKVWTHKLTFKQTIRICVKTKACNVSFLKIYVCMGCACINYNVDILGEINTSFPCRCRFAAFADYCSLLQNIYSRIYVRLIEGLFLLHFF